MKNLKIKLSVFSFLLILATLVFFTSCEQELDIISEVDKVQLDETSLMFELPETFSEMSDEELKIFFENTSQEELLEVVNVITEEDIKMRGCDDYGSWENYASYCSVNNSCPRSRGYLLQRRKCIQNWWFDSWEYRGFWLADCCY